MHDSNAINDSKPMKNGLRKDASAGGPDAIAPCPPSPPRNSWRQITLAALFVRRERWTLTWTGRLVTLAVVAGVAVFLARGLCGFLAVTSPVGGQFLVVEGWVPVFALREAAEQFRKGTYKKVITVEMTKEDAEFERELPEHFGRENLIEFGVPSDLVATAASKIAYRDRTFHSAMALRQWLQEQGLRTSSIDVLTIGPHARRSRLLFEKALGDEVAVGIISIEDPRFDPNHWWRSSVGVRTVVDESIAYLYARIVFSPPQ